MRFIRLIVRRVVRGLGHLDFSILSLNGDSKVPIFLFLSVPFSKKEEECRKQKIRVQKLNTQEQKKQPHDKKRRQRKTQI